MLDLGRGGVSDLRCHFGMGAFVSWKRGMYALCRYMGDVCDFCRRGTEDGRRAFSFLFWTLVYWDTLLQSSEVGYLEGLSCRRP